LIDKATGELVEFGTYQAYGAAESDHRPSRWAACREPLRFSGKEEDIEVGLAYFGARYYSPYLNTWLSPDPVTIHGLGSDANPYAYVHGSPLIGIDPDGNEPITIGVIVTAAVVGAAVGAGSSIVYQGTTNGWNNINWGWDGVAGAAASGAVSGAVSAGVGGAVGNLVGSQVVGGMIGGAAGSAAGQTATYVATGRSEGFGEGVLIGGASGLAGGALGTGGGSKPDIGRAIAGSSAGAVAGTAVAAAFGQKVTAETFMLSLGSGVAAVIASHSVPDSVKGWGSTSGTGGSGTREPALEPASGQGAPRGPLGSDRFLYLPPSGDPLEAMFPELPPLTPEAVRAWGEGSRTILEYGDGAREVRSGGSAAWRNNNPGNLRGSPDQIGRAHGFAVFPTEAAGEGALRSLLRSDRYSSLTLDRAIGRYAPSYENNTAAYRAAVRNGIGVTGSTRIDQLTNSQFDALVNTIRQIEVWRPGTVTWR
jgi:RHS repeat-associated protein